MFSDIHCVASIQSVVWNLNAVPPFAIAVGTSTEWTRVWYTYHDQPTNARAASLSLVLGAYSTPVYIAAPMLEAGVTWPSDWDMGGAAPVVIMDQIPASSGRYPLRNVELNLLEA